MWNRIKPCLILWFFWDWGAQTSPSKANGRKQKHQTQYIILNQQTPIQLLNINSSVQNHKILHIQNSHKTILELYVQTQLSKGSILLCLAPTSKLEKHMVIQDLLLFSRNEKAFLLSSSFSSSTLEQHNRKQLLFLFFLWFFPDTMQSTVGSGLRRTWTTSPSRGGTVTQSLIFVLSVV